MNNLTATLILFSLLAGALLTILGLAHLHWPQDLPWSGIDVLMRYAYFLIVCTALVFVGSWWSRKSALLVGAAVAVGYALLAGVLWPLLVTLWFAVASAILGRYVLTVLHIKLEGDGWLTNFLVGAGVYGTAAGLLAHFPVNYPGVYGVALSLPLILGWRVVVEQVKNILALVAQRSHAGFNVNKLDVAIAVVALVYFVVALMPEVGFDALAMHLFVSAHLALRHQWGFDASTYVWAVMPMLGDWIFSVGYMLAGETAARLINVGFIFILGWLVRGLVLWAGGSAIGARWAVLVFLSTPLTFTEGSSLFIESVWASFVVAGTLLVLRVSTASGNPKVELPVAGLLLGCALAAKAVTFTILPVLLLLLVWRYRSWYKTAGLLLLALSLSLFLAIGIIPYATAWRLTGNPVFPLFNKIFQSPYYPSASNFDNPLFSAGITWDVLYRVTFESGKYLEAYAGASGFQWLLLFIPALVTLIALRQVRGVALLLVGTFAVAAVFYSQSYLRYVFPSCAILAAAMGVALSAEFSTRSFIRNGWYAAVVTAVALNLLFLNAGAFYRDFALKPILHSSARDRYLLDRLPIRNAVELVNHLNIGRKPVAVFSAPMTAGLAADALYPNWYNYMFQGEIASIHTEQDVTNILLKRGVNFIILDSNWNGVGGVRGPETRALFEKVTEKLAEYGSLSIRKVKIDYSFKTELLGNPDFTSIKGWALAPEAKYDAATGVVLTNVASSATQAVVVSSGRRYLNTVIARCAKEPTLGRIQINWLDANGQFVSTDIQTFECSSAWVEHAMEVTAPPNAANAVVYTTGHTSIPLEFKGNSLRQ
ncbi:MAG: glycosyl transferase [Candidatus Gottesmanbacteria bacterium]|nr:glycosyl transferase [Candidatus Gottesmanbacteria bacterium]